MASPDGGLSHPVDLRESYGGKYRLERDPAALHEPGGRSDPWFYTIPCGKGHIFPHSRTMLALWWKSPRRLDRACPALTIYQDADDEKVYLFKPDDFRVVARVVGPRRKRRLSDAQREALRHHGRRFQFQNHGAKG